MKPTPEIEAALERSLRNQVKVPPLGNSFDTAVWARIEAEETRVKNPASLAPSTSPAGARWLYIINAVGFATVAVFVLFFGARMLGGMDLNDFLPEISEVALDGIVAKVSMGIAGVAVIFGLMFTPLGRRLREELG